MAQITSRGELEEWLKDKPADWAQVIAARAALRALPYAFAYESNDSDKWMKANAVAFFRAVTLPLIAFDFPDRDMFEPIQRAGSSLAATSANSHAYGAIDQATMTFTSHEAMIGGKFQNIISFTGGAIDFEIQSLGGDSARIWSIVSEDCNALESDEYPDTAVSRLRNYNFAHQLGFDRAGTWASASKRLYALDPTCEVWLNLYDCRILGKKSAFDIPGDNDRAEDKAILARLADATNEDFWDKGATYVNTTLQGWIDEARERVAPPPAEPSQLTDLLPDPQDGRSPVFGTDATGRIAISAHAGADTLRTDPQAQARHALARRMAQALGDALRGHNNAGYLTGMAEAYVEAMGETAADADPSILIFAGDQLREAIAKHRRAGPDDDLQPLPSAADRDASGFISAHNMYAGSDPHLDDLDRTTRGPDAPLPAATPAEVVAIAKGSFGDGILAETSHDYIVAAAAVAPAVYEPGDRHSRFASGLAQNFGRYGIELLAAYPDETAWVSVAAGVGALVVLGPVAAVGGTISSVVAAYYMARNIIANERTYRKLLSTSPAGEHNFNRVIRFLKSLPIKSLKDD